MVAPPPMDTTLSTNAPTFMEDSQLEPQGDPAPQGTPASSPGDNTALYMTTPPWEDTTETQHHQVLHLEHTSLQTRVPWGI